MPQIRRGDDLIRSYKDGFDLLKIPVNAFTFDAGNTSGSNRNADQEDVGRIADMDYADANTFTVLSEAAMRYPFIPNQCLYVCSLGAGVTTLTAGSNVTITPVDGLTLVLKAAPSYAMLRYIGDNVWHAMGHLESA